MKQIVLYGDRRDTQLGDVLRLLLSCENRVCSLSGRRLSTAGRGPGILLIEADRLREMDVEDGVLVLKKGARLGPLRSVHKTTSIVISAEDAKNIARLSGYLPNVYTCGFSSKDFVTFSSKEESSAVVSLQRGVRLPGRETLVEPFEIPCAGTGKLRDYTVLAAVLTGILAGALQEGQYREGKILLS